MNMTCRIVAMVAVGLGFYLGQHDVLGAPPERDRDVRPDDRAPRAGGNHDDRRPSGHARKFHKHRRHHRHHHASHNRGQDRAPEMRRDDHGPRGDFRRPPMRDDGPQGPDFRGRGGPGFDGPRHPRFDGQRDGGGRPEFRRDFGADRRDDAPFGRGPDRARDRDDRRAPDMMDSRPEHPRRRIMDDRGPDRRDDDRRDDRRIDGRRHAPRIDMNTPEGPRGGN